MQKQLASSQESPRRSTSSRASCASPLRLPSAPSLPASAPSEDMGPSASAVSAPAMRAETAENVSLFDAIFKPVPGQKIEKQAFFSRNEVETISNELSKRGLSFDPVGIRVGGFGFVAFGNFDGQGVAVKIADQTHKDALLADREFMAVMQRTREMQLVPKFIRGISETAMLQIRLPEKRDGNRNYAYILVMERGAENMRSYFDLMKQRSIVKSMCFEDQVRPCQETVYGVRTVCQLLAQVHEKGMAHGDLNPSNLLLIEVDKSYSIHGEGFVIMDGKHYKIVLCDGGGSVCGSCVYMHCSDDLERGGLPTVRKSTPRGLAAAGGRRAQDLLLASMTCQSMRAADTKSLQLTKAMSAEDVALSRITRYIQTSGSPGWRLISDLDPSKKWKAKMSPKESDQYKIKYLKFRQKQDIAAIGFLALVPLLHKASRQGLTSKKEFENKVYEFCTTAKDTNELWEMLAREHWVLPPHRFTSGPIGDEYNLHNNLDFVINCFNGNFSNLRMALHHDFLTSPIYKLEYEKQLRSRIGLLVPPRLVSVPERLQDPNSPGQRLCAGARLRLVKNDKKWYLSVSSYGQVNIGDLVAVYGIVFREGRNALCDCRHFVQITAGAISGGISLDGKITADCPLDTFIESVLLGSFINSMPAGKANVTDPEDNLWDPRMKQSVGHCWPKEHMRAFMFSKINVQEDEEVEYGWTYPYI